MNARLTLAALVREDGENKEDNFGGRGVAADTTGPGFSRAFDTAPHAIRLVDAVLWGQIQGFPAHRHKKEGTTALKRMPGALNRCVSLYTRHSIGLVSKSGATAHACLLYEKKKRV